MVDGGAGDDKALARNLLRKALHGAFKNSQQSGTDVRTEFQLRTGDLVDLGEDEDGRELGVRVLGDGRMVEEHAHGRAVRRGQVDVRFLDKHC